MPTPVERKALNEGRFRAANEKLDRGARELLAPADDSLVPFLCECPSVDCNLVVMLTLAEYDEVRSTGEGGFAALGHEDLSIERVVARNDRFVRTEKFGRAGEIHAGGDPRNE
jgi:hypothetical protein